MHDIARPFIRDGVILCKPRVQELNLVVSQLPVAENPLCDAHERAKRALHLIRVGSTLTCEEVGHASLAASRLANAFIPEKVTPHVGNAHHLLALHPVLPIPTLI